MEKLPWYQSKILQQQIAQFIIAACTMLGVTDVVNWEEVTQGIFAGVAGAVAVWTVLTRIFKANPPITDKAVVAEEAFQEAHKP